MKLLCLRRMKEVAQANVESISSYWNVIFKAVIPSLSRDLPEAKDVRDGGTMPLTGASSQLWRSFDSIRRSAPYSAQDDKRCWRVGIRWRSEYSRWWQNREEFQH